MEDGGWRMEDFLPTQSISYGGGGLLYISESVIYVRPAAAHTYTFRCKVFSKRGGGGARGGGGSTMRGSRTIYQAYGRMPPTQETQPRYDKSLSINLLSFLFL